MTLQRHAAVVALAALATLGVAAAGFGVGARQLQTIHEDSVHAAARLDAMEDLRTSAARCETAVRRARPDTDQGEIQEACQAAEHSLSVLGRVAEAGGADAPDVAALGVGFAELGRIYGASPGRQAGAILATPDYQRARSSLDELSDRQRIDAAATEERAADLFALLRLFALVLPAIGAVLFIVSAATLALRLSRRFSAVSSATRRVAFGDLDARIEIPAGGELEEVAHAFARVTHELRTAREITADAKRTAQDLASEVARAAIASAGLREVGTALEELAVTADLLGASLEGSGASRLHEALEVLRSRDEALRGAITRDATCRRVLDHLDALARHWSAEIDQAQARSLDLDARLDHVRAVVAKRLAQASSPVEREDRALRLGQAGADGSGRRAA